NVGFRAGEPAAAALSEPVRGVLELAAIGGLALLAAYIVGAKESRGGRGPRLRSGGAGAEPSPADDPRHSSPRPSLDPKELCTHLTNRRDTIMSANASHDPPLTMPRGHRIGRGLMPLIALALLGGPAFAGAEKSDDGPKPEVKHFTSGGKEIGAEYFAPG